MQQFSNQNEKPVDEIKKKKRRAILTFGAEPQENKTKSKTKTK